MKLLMTPLVFIVAFVKTVKLTVKNVRGKPISKWTEAMIHGSLEYDLEVGRKMSEDPEFRKQCKTNKERLAFLWNELIS